MNVEAASCLRQTHNEYSSFVNKNKAQYSKAVKLTLKIPI